ncbi:hypothetical protein B0H21DRAFT_386333 [Amylocystis lapponica]|nr:hypothetical protein B0H21DRAFT_386333 [Amylocystis lapponica]
MASLRMTSLSRASLPTHKGVRWAHVHYDNMPFTYKNRAAFRAKYLAFVGTGFVIPFVAVYYQLWKSGGAA